MESCSSNASTKDFFLVGFPALQDFQTPLFFVFLLFYLLILVGNAIIITVVVVDRTLHKPMYFFLLNLSVLDVLFTTTTIPKMVGTYHLLVVGTYYSSIAVAYVSYRADIPVDVHVMSNVVFCILTPLLNPIIYTLRNKEVKSAVRKWSIYRSCTQPMPLAGK
ncbi:olfactory receptor 2AT4 [Mergus octosetaceus]